MDAARELDLIRAEVEQAADAFISASDKGLELVELARQGSTDALAALDRTFIAILEACAFQDLVGQRLSRLEAAAGGLSVRREADPLLRGPADPGHGLSQADADVLFDKA